MFMSRDQNAVQNSNIQIGNKSFETVEQLTYFGTTITNQTSIQENLEQGTEEDIWAYEGASCLSRVWAGYVARMWESKSCIWGFSGKT